MTQLTAQEIDDLYREYIVHDELPVPYQEGMEIFLTALKQRLEYAEQSSSIRWVKATDERFLEATHWRVRFHEHGTHSINRMDYKSHNEQLIYFHNHDPLVRTNVEFLLEEKQNNDREQSSSISCQRELFIAMIEKMKEEDWREADNGFAGRVFDRLQSSEAASKDDVEQEDKPFEDIIGTVIKYYKFDGIDNKKHLIKLAKDNYHIIPKTTADGRDLLERAGNYAHNRELQQPDIHPKTALFQGFIEGYKAATNKETAPVEKKRYFIVNYTANHEKGFMRGQIDITTHNGSFINQKITTQQISETNSAKDVVITNVLEISKEDFEAWQLNSTK